MQTKTFNNSLKKIPLGLPMTLSALGTVFSLWKAKSAHGSLGTVWLILSLWHGWQHFGKLKHEAKNLLNRAEKSSPLDKFLSKTEVRSFMPGRVRLYHPAMRENADAYARLANLARSISAVKKVSENSLTGTLLIEYDREEIKNKPGWRKIEKYLQSAKIK